MTYKLLLTTLGQQKIAAAASAGSSPLHITEFAVGQGVNVDFSKRLDEQVLVSKRYQGTVESVAPVASHPGQYEITCIVPQNQGGWTIREMGLIDTNGNLIWVGQLPEVQKPAANSTSAVDYRIKAVVSIDNPDVNLVIDANVVTATQSWVSANFVSNPRFAQFLDLAFPLGYKYWSHNNVNPKPLFDAMFGFETFWRRLQGVHLVAVKDGDSYINHPMLNLGQRGVTELATSVRPHTYPAYTSYLFERYDPDTVVTTVWNVTANKTGVNEGDAIRFTVTANNLPDGQILDWQVKEGLLNAASNDITAPDKTESGTVILKNGQAIINFTTMADDNLDEPKKHVRLTVDAPANLSINVPINDAGHHETVIHISESTYDGIVLDEYYKSQVGYYPASDEVVRFLVDEGVDIVAPSTVIGGIEPGTHWGSESEIIIENRGRILGRGGDGGRSAYQYKFWNESDGDALSPSKSNMRSPVSGRNGGPAIKALNKAIRIDNYSLIAGGGGGGGGLGAYKPSDLSFVFGGGGTGGGAPFGLRSPNESTYTMYKQDPVVTDLKLPLPPAIEVDNRIYGILFQRPSDSIANYSGTDRDYHYGSQYNAASYSENRAINVEISATSGGYAPENFKKYRVMESGGYMLADAIPALMSQNATLNTSGIGGANVSASAWSNGRLLASSSYEGTNIDITEGLRGGNGGGLGEDGEDGYFKEIYSYNTTDNKVVVIDQSSVAWFIPPATGGRAGLIFEGNVNINNLSDGETKGRTS